MIDKLDRAYQPELPEISEFISNPLYDELYRLLTEEYKALIKIDYSRDKVLLGWNVKFRKAGRALCTVYPFPGCFKVLIVVGQKEVERVEALLPAMSEAMQKIYRETQEGMGQRWLIIELTEHDALYEDVCALIAIRRASK